jgi:hypothetical protein
MVPVLRAVPAPTSQCFMQRPPIYTLQSIIQWQLQYNINITLSACLFKSRLVHKATHPHNKKSITTQTWPCLFTVLLWAVKVLFYQGFYLVLLLSSATSGGREFHVVMTLFNTVCFPASVLDLGTVKRPLVACLVLPQSTA